MHYRSIAKEDYQAFLPWFLNRQWTKPPAHNTFSDQGIAIYFDEMPAACLWVYLTGSGIAYLDWIASNPVLEEHDQTRAKMNLIEYVQRELCNAVEPKINLLVCNIADIELIQDMKRIGFYSKRGLVQMSWIRPGSDDEDQATK